MIYDSARSITANALWKVPIQGGNPIQIPFRQYPGSTAVSPDGTRIAVSFIDEQTGKGPTAIIPASGGQPIKVLDVSLPLAGVGAEGRELLWAPDGRSLIYVGAGKASANLWSQPIEGGKSTQITHFTSGRIFSLAMSRDGKRFAGRDECHASQDKRNKSENSRVRRTYLVKQT